jgi:hypothetical protein
MPASEKPAQEPTFVDFSLKHAVQGVSGPTRTITLSLEDILRNSFAWSIQGNGVFGRK